MGGSNSCAKLSVSCFGWKKSRVFRRNKRNLSESIVRLRDDETVCVEGLPTARVIPKRNQIRITFLEESAIQPTVTQSLELISIPPEDQSVKRPVHMQIEGHHFHTALKRTLPPPLPPRKIERHFSATNLPMVNEQASFDMAENPNPASKDEISVQGDEVEKCDKPQEIMEDICLNLEDSGKWASPKIPPRSFENVTDGKVEVAEGDVKSHSDLTSVPPIPPRRF